MPEGAMEAFLTSVNHFFTQTMTWLGEVLETIVTHPVLLVMVCAMSVIGFSVGLLKRLIRM